MKNIFRLLFVTAGIALMSVSCDKVGKLPYYGSGVAPVLTSSVTSVSLAPADSNKVVVSFAWSNPKYSTDSTTQKFILEIDSAGRNFTKEITQVVTGKLGISLTGQQLNATLAAFGFTSGTASTINVRITSSYANNNEPYQSNVVSLQVTPYVVPITLTPSSTNALTLLISNAANTAVSFKWTASQYGADTFSYALQFDTVGGKFSSPQLIKYGATLSGALLVSDLNTAAILAGVLAGTTKNVEFRVVGYIGNNVYSNPTVYSNISTISITTYLPFLYMYVPGDYQGWSPSTAPSLGATVPNLTSYEGYINMPTGNSFQFKITPKPNWDNAYGTNDPETVNGTVLSGTMSLSGSNNLDISKLGGGYYRFSANTTTNTWSVDKVSWGIVGDATANGWSNNDIPMVYSAVTNQLTATLNLSSTGAFKFRANNDWNDAKHNFGIDANGNLAYNGANNITVPSTGNYTVTLDLSTPLNYKYSLKKN